MWKPLGQKHAIDSVSMVVSFTEPAPSLIVRRATKAFEQAKSYDGFGPAQPVQQINVDMGSDTQPQISARATGAVMFQHTAIDKNWDGSVSQKMIDQVQLGPQVFVLESWRYRSWSDLIEKYMRAIGPALEAAIAAVSIQSIRLQYVDRFFFVGAPHDADPVGVIRDNSEFVSPKILRERGLWHSHVGVLQPENADGALLRQANVDCVDLAGPGELSGRRGIGIMTALEERYPGQGREFNDLDEVKLVFDALHGHVIDLFKGVVSDDALAKVGMKP